MRMFDRHFLVTAKHVFGKCDRQLFFVGRSGSHLVPLHIPGVYTVSCADEDLDVAVIPLQLEQLAELRGFAFVPEQFLEVELDPYVNADDEFDVFGFPASHSQCETDRCRKNVRQNSFFFRTTAVLRPKAATRERIDESTHLLLEFAPKKITVGGKRGSRTLAGSAPVGVASGTASSNWLRS